MGLISHFREKSACTPADASILRGKAAYVGSQLQGRALRFCERALIQRQYSDGAQVAITKELEGAFHFLQLAFQRLPSKQISLVGQAPLSIIYTDAAFQPGDPISYGWVVLPESGSARSGCGVVPTHVFASLRKRKSQILSGELLAVLSALTNCEKELEGHRLLIFVDNHAALSSLVGGGAKHQDLASIVCLIHVKALEMGSTIWFEFVESDSNPADGPSRNPYTPWSSSELARWMQCTVEHATLPESIDSNLAPIEALSAMDRVRSVVPEAE